MLVQYDPSKKTIIEKDDITDKDREKGKKRG